MKSNQNQFLFVLKCKKIFLIPHKAYASKTCRTAFNFLHGIRIKKFRTLQLIQLSRYQNYSIKTSFFSQKDPVKNIIEQSSLVYILTKYISLGRKKGDTAKQRQFKVPRLYLISPQIHDHTCKTASSPTILTILTNCYMCKIVDI